MSMGGRSGLSFIEILVVLLIMALIAGSAIPAYQNRLPAYKQRELVSNIATLIAQSRQQAIETQKVHRVWFDLKNHRAKVEIQTGGKDKDGYPAFEDIKSVSIKTEYVWPDNFTIEQFFVDGAEMVKRPGIKTEEVWFYAVPKGLVQPTIINIADSVFGSSSEKQGQISLVINPFTARIKQYDTFQKP